MFQVMVSDIFSSDSNIPSDLSLVALTIKQNAIKAVASLLCSLWQCPIAFQFTRPKLHRSARPQVFIVTWKQQWQIGHSSFEPLALVMGDRLNFIIDHWLESVDTFDAILPIIIDFHIYTELSPSNAPKGNSGASLFFLLSICKRY